MKKSFPARLFLLIFSVLPLAAPCAPGPDTTGVDAMARQLLIRLKEKKPASVDSLHHLMNQTVADKKESPTLLYYWANAEMALQNMDMIAAYQFAHEAVGAPKQTVDNEDIARLHLLYARTCQYVGQFTTARSVIEKNIAFARSEHIDNILPQAYLQLAELLYLTKQIGDMVVALEHAIEYAEAEGNPWMTEIAYSRLGVIRLTYERDFAFVRNCFEKCYDISSELGDSTRMSVALTNRAWNYYLEKMLDSSLYWYKKSLSVSEPIGMMAQVANAYGNIGTIYRDKKLYDQALKAWTKAIETAREVKDWYTVSWVYNDMSRMAYETNEFQKAYDFQVLYKQYSDSVVNKANSEGVALARVKYETDTRKKELEMLSLRVKNQKLMLFGVAAVLVLSLFIGLLLLRQAKINAKRKISEMDQRILEVTQANLRQQMNPHFIFNTLNSIQYYMYKHDKLATNNYLTKFSSLMRKILENSQHTAITIRDEVDALRLYLELESIRFRDKFDYEIIIDEEIDPLLYKIPTMLIQPYVENAICHGLMLKEVKGKVTVSITLRTDYLCCVIEDDGIGRDASREINSKKQHTHNSLGTRITESRLNLVGSFYGKRLQTTYTDLKDENGVATGTRVEIHIPILT